MKCINIAVVDDQATIREAAVRNIRSFMFPLDYEFKIGEYESAEIYLESNHWKEDDLLFLDIELPNMNGLELSKKLAYSNQHVKVVFLTSYEHYMKDAFGLNVLHYLKKENMAEEVKIAMANYMDTIYQHSKNMIAFRTEKNDLILSQNQIILIYIENRSVFVVTQYKQTKLTVKSLKTYIEILDPEVFVQPNSGYLVNMHYIRFLKGQEMSVEYHEEIIMIARRKVKAIQDEYLVFLSKGRRL